MYDFMILKAFFIEIHPHNAPEIKKSWCGSLRFTSELSITLMALVMVVLIQLPMVVFLEITKLILVVLFLILIFCTL